MTTLVDFIEARLAEDERHARAAGWHRWEVGDMTTIVATGNGKVVAGVGLDYDARFIARHDPARVLRDVAAKRRALARHQPVEVWAGWEHLPPGDPGSRRVIRIECSSCRTGTCWDDYDATCGALDWPCPEVLDLAAPYADHPDYQSSWSPETVVPDA